MPLTEEELLLLGNVILGELCNRLSIPQIRLAVGRAGFNAHRIPAEDRRSSVVPAVQRLFAELPYERKLAALPILAESVPVDEVKNLLRRHGYQFANGEFIPVAMLDERELQFLPANSAEQISQAFSRLLDDDENGAITSACGAVDTATIAAYENRGLGQPPNSFQAKVNTVMNNLGVYAEIEQDLESIKWASAICGLLEGKI
jgi:hypothetical protein